MSEWDPNGNAHSATYGPGGPPSDRDRNVILYEGLQAIWWALAVIGERLSDQVDATDGIGAKMADRGDHR